MYQDSIENNYQLAKNDLCVIKLDALDATSQEVQKTENLIMNQIPLLKEIFTHLQGLSKKYPYIDSFTIREHFFKKLQGFSLTRYDYESFDAIMAKAIHSGQNIEGIPGGGNFCRGTFIEIIVRLAHHFFSAHVTEKDKQGKEGFNHVPL